MSPDCISNTKYHVKTVKTVNNFKENNVKLTLSITLSDKARLLGILFALQSSLAFRASLTVRLRSFTMESYSTPRAEHIKKAIITIVSL